MATEREFLPRRERQMGEVMVDLAVENVFEPDRRVVCKAMVDTGAFGLVLPNAWKTQLGGLPVLSLVDLELADQRVVTAEIRGPAHGSTTL